MGTGAGVICGEGVIDIAWVIFGSWLVFVVIGRLSIGSNRVSPFLGRLYSTNVASLSSISEPISGVMPLSSKLVTSSFLSSPTRTCLIKSFDTVISS